ncbi:serine/threonine phosphatase [Leptolyngbya sp. AN02str]|uniref:serine/threonine phosphatase n=1 Tax=Leptolyngbya sp. AN02str TaxID=3423363 RepID=UPI003D3178AD
MIVCPQCQFENPDTNKFCLRCGVALTEKSCPACGAAVPLDAEKCPSCQEPTATIWRAVITVEPPAVDPDETVDVAQQLAQDDLKAAFAAADPPGISFLEDDYIDAQRRYRRLDELEKDAIAKGSVEVRVVDGQPFSPSPLEMLFRHPEMLDLEEENLEASIEQEVTRLGIPTLALSYLALEEQLYPSLPQIHDAWQKGDIVVVILEDRSDLTALAEVWRNLDVPMFQLLHLLHQIAELWTVLQPQGFAQSLLEVSNLRVDEDQLLYLQRLYSDATDKSGQLLDLGKFWKQLFSLRSPQIQMGTLAHLCDELEAGAIDSVDVLRSRLEAIAAELQTPTTPPPAVVPVELPLSNPDDDDEATIGLPPSALPGASSPLDLPPSADVSLGSSPTLLELENLDDDLPSEGEDMPTIVLPMKLVALDDAGCSDVGRQRDHNEDHFNIVTHIQKMETPSGRSIKARGLYILCDGMGGHASGEVASVLAAETLKQYFDEHWVNELPSETMVREAVLAANRAIYDLNQQNDSSGSGRMGTTLVVLLVQDMRAVLAHVGDSRLYRYSRRRGLEQVTVDHEVGQREIQRGVEPAIAYARPDAYQLTQALGPRDENFVNPDVQFLDITEDLLLLLCSDGLTDNDLLEKHWETHVDPLLSSATNLEGGVSQLVDLANKHNGHDNITAVVVRAKLRPNLEALKR